MARFTISSTASGWMRSSHTQIDARGLPTRRVRRPNKQEHAPQHGRKPNGGHPSRSGDWARAAGHRPAPRWPVHPAVFVIERRTAQHVMRRPGDDEAGGFPQGHAHRGLDGTAKMKRGRLGDLQAPNLLEKPLTRAGVPEVDLARREASVGSNWIFALGHMHWHTHGVEPRPT